MAYAVAADGGEDVVVARVHEVEPDGVERALPLSVLAAGLVLPLPAGHERPLRRLAPQPLPRAQLRHDRRQRQEVWFRRALLPLLRSFLLLLLLLLLPLLHRRPPGVRVRGGGDGDGDSELTRRPLPAWLGRRRTANLGDLTQHSTDYTED